MKDRAPGLAVPAPTTAPTPAAHRDADLPSVLGNRAMAAALAGAGAASGAPLPPALRARFESYFGADLRGVRVHDDAPAASWVRDLGASAATVDDHISFAAGAFAPSTPAGDRLIAHELAHVLQHAGGAAAPGFTTPGDAAETEAMRAADRVAAGQRVEPIRARAATVARATPANKTETVEFDVDPADPGKLVHQTPPEQRPLWIDTVMTKVGYSVWDEYFVWIEGLEKPIHVREHHVDVALQTARPISLEVYDSYAQAIDAVARAPRSAGDAAVRYAYYWGAGGAAIFPTIISPATAPQTAETMRQTRIAYAEYVQREATGMAAMMVLFKALGAAYQRAGKLGGGPNPPRGTNEPAKTEGAKTEGAKTEGAKTEGAKTEAAKTEAAKAEAAKTEAAKAEAAKAEAAKAEAAKAEAAKTEAAKAEAAKAEAAKAEAAKAEAAKAEAKAKTAAEAEAQANALAKQQVQHEVKKFDFSNDPDATSAVDKAWRDSFKKEYTSQREAGQGPDAATKSAKKIANATARDAAQARAIDAARARARAAVASGTAFKSDAELGADTVSAEKAYRGGTQGQAARKLSSELSGKTVREMTTTLDAEASAGKCSKIVAPAPASR